MTILFILIDRFTTTRSPSNGRFVRFRLSSVLHLIHTRSSWCGSASGGLELSSSCSTDTAPSLRASYPSPVSQQRTPVKSTLTCMTVRFFFLSPQVCAFLGCTSRTDGSHNYRCARNLQQFSHVRTQRDTPLVLVIDQLPSPQGLSYWGY